MTTVNRASTTPATVRPEPRAESPRSPAPQAAQRNTLAQTRNQDAFVAQALRFDGSKPAAGTTNTQAWIPVDAPVRGNPSNRNAHTYNEVLNQFAVGNNPRYTPRGGNTYCNIFVWDATRAMGAEIPHWVDGAGNPTGVGKGRELNANATVDWLHQNGARHGYRQVSAAEAQQLANQGHPAVAVWKNPGGIGHVAMVRPGEVTGQGPAIAQAGSKNFNNGHVKDSFGSRPVEYWVNDSGKTTGSPSQPPPPTPTTPAPTPTTPAPGGSSGVPQVDLKRGSEGPAVKQLQDALVKLGYLTKEQVATGPGTFGPKTEAAVAKFQGDHGISPNSGNYGPKTRAAMTAELNKLNAPAVPQSTLRRGAEGPEVKQLQDALVKLGHMTAEQVATGPGTFGPKTESALKAFQASRGLEVDGVYGPQSRQALSEALGSRAPSTPGPVTGPSAPTTGGTDAAKAARLNDMLKNSGLRGQGEHILAMSKKYNVPPEVALAMFWKEAQFNTTGVAPKNNNPGNLRFAEWEKQFGGQPNGGFTKFPSVEKGIEAYFRLMDVGYRKFIDTKDWQGLINKYAPPSDGNNSAQYANQIAQWMEKYRAQLNG
ncbi:MAG TPA: peptidoglycan-binding protein [Archangium sp.]|jgi:peptidoglycan hydrolase-like protein with peptidoglycan-binding domain|uniref:peptidoglycan-binding protein n=1 Tax=Archangium sp. TaxID=1872627 RepID=UPI002ED7E9DE